MIVAGLAGSSLAGPTAWVSNEKDNTVTVVDLDRLDVIETISVGQRPRGLVFSRDYAKLYICASDDNTVQVMDVATRRIVHDLPSGDDPEFFDIHPNDRLLYIANEDDAITTVVDTESRQVIAQINVGVEPEGMAVSHDGKWAVTTSETTNMVHWIDVEKQVLAANTLIDQRPRYARFSADDRLLWASSEIGGTVSVIDTETKEVVHRIAFDVQGVPRELVQPVGMRLTSDGKTAFIALGPANRIAVVDAQTYEVEDYILVGQRVWHADLTSDESLLVTTNGVSNDVTVIDVVSRKPIKSIPVGRFPWGVVIKP
jgi:PQQ-dependent catabolism-associated beta-propeller protein